MMSFNAGGWKPAFIAVVVFFAWTLTSFLCHECAKMFLQLSENMFLVSRNTKSLKELYLNRFLLALLLTFVQCTCCFLVVRYEARQRHVNQPKALTLLITSHILATLATNYSMAFIEASSTLAIKLTEPVTMAVAHHVIFRTSVPLQTVISLPLIICGALVFTGENINQLSDTTGVALAFTSNIILAARNITLKKLQNESTESSSIVLKPNLTISVTILFQVGFLTLLYYMETQGIVPRKYSLLACLSLASGIFHVTYSYISTNIVLKVMNVVSHSIANIFKRLVVVLLLCALGNSPLSVNNFLGLAIAIGGLLMYKQAYKNTKHEDMAKETVEVREDSGRASLRHHFLLYIFLVVVLSFATLTLMEKFTLQQTTTMDFYKDRNVLNTTEAPPRTVSHLGKAEVNREMPAFLSWRLVDHPEETDKRAQTLTNNEDVVEEAQRILVNLLKDLLGNVKHVMLLEMATYENKGDPAIAVGEIMLLRRMNISIVFYCETSTCSKHNILNQAIAVNKKYARNELIILLQGGGNLVGYRSIDHIRELIIMTFPDRKIILLSQSIWLNTRSATDMKHCHHIYSHRRNLVIFLRDRKSFEIARTYFLDVRLILAPDMAFGIGMVPRQLPPIYDIVWLRRSDVESSKYTLPVFPSNLSVEVADWHGWKSNRGQTGMENAFLIASAGFQFLQRGRIVVTDRLHGHILSTLMNIPHVLIDNPPHLKLSSFKNSWTKSLSNTILVSNGTLALEAAKELIKRYHSSLPSVGPKDMYVVRN